MKGGFDRAKSLEEIEQHDWGEPSLDSYLVTTCHRLHRKPLREFTVEDLRIMIGQSFSLPILIPLAVERLEAEPLAEGCFFSGDLLSAVLNADDSFWRAHPDSLEPHSSSRSPCQGVSFKRRRKRVAEHSGNPRTNF